MFEKLFGAPKKKVVEAKNLPAQPRPFSTVEERYGYELNFNKDAATERFLDSGAAEAKDILFERSDPDSFPAPSQGSVDQKGMRRSAAEEIEYAQRRLTDTQPRHTDNSWKEHRDTPYRPEA